MPDLVMPRLSDTMEEGTILRWLKRDGERVQRGDELVEIETDKASMTYESDLEGSLEIVAREGETLAIGEVIAHVGAAGDAPAPAAGGEAAGQARQPDGDDAREAPATPPSPPAASIQDADGEAVAREGAKPRVKASPLARRLAHEAGVALEGLAGSGPSGRIVRADVEAATMGTEAAAPTATPPAGSLSGTRSAAAQTAAQTPAQTPAPAPSAGGDAPRASRAASAPALEGVMTAKGETSTYELSRTQQVIARRMAESKATIPDFSLDADIDMEECVALRAQLRELTDAPPTYNDMLVKACALALREHPRVNGGYRDGRIELHSRVNVGVAVAADDQDALHSALVVPTIFDADMKSLGEIAREARALAERVRAGAVTPPELSGATFTVSNLGMYGIRRFHAIINPPQAAILAVGAVEQRAVVHDGAPTPRQAMTVTLACDHRMLYGADAARFLARVRALLESPSALLL